MKLKISTILFQIIFFSFTIFSCGESSNDNANDTDVPQQADEENISEETTNLDFEEAVEEVSQEPLESASVPNQDWQINNYANFLIGNNIVANPELMDPSKGINWFYETLDVKGGFASVRGMFEGWKEFVVWRMADGDDLVGEMSVECGPACGYTFNFYKGRGSEIAEYPLDKLFPIDAMNRHCAEMTTKILEKYPVDYPEDSQLVYNFPQKGTGMIVDVVLGADEIQVPIIELAWDKSKFYVKEFLNDPNPQE